MAGLTFGSMPLTASALDWANPAASVAQPVAMPVEAFAPAPAMSMPAMSSLNAGSFNFGSGQLGSNPFAPTPEASAMAWQGGSTGAPQTTWGKVGSWLSNGQNLGMVAQSLGTLAQAYLGFKNLSLAKDNLSFQKDAFAKNFANAVGSYNTSLEDRIRGRTSDYAGKENDVQAYLAKHKLKG